MHVARLALLSLIVSLAVSSSPASAMGLPCVDYQPVADVKFSFDQCAFAFCAGEDAASACASRSADGQLYVEVCVTPVGCRLLLVYHGPRADDLPIDGLP